MVAFQNSNGLIKFALVMTAGLAFVGCPNGCPPTASFSATPSSGTIPLTVSFSDESAQGGSEITEWMWNFGDGTISTMQNPTHVYEVEGNYTVSLIVLTSAGYDAKVRTGYIRASRTIPVISKWPTASAIMQGFSLADSKLNGGDASVSGVFAFDDSSITPEAGVFRAKVTFIPSDVVNFATVASSVYVHVVAPPDNVWFVKSGGSGSGRNWKNAFGRIQDAVNAAASAGGGSVWVTAGTYSGSAGEVVESFEDYGGNSVETFETSQSYVVMLANNVKVYGGFSGKETNFAERDLNGDRTIIDGGSTAVCVRGADGAGLDGLTLTHGLGAYGGGLLNWHVSPEVSNCFFVKNSATEDGGGMCNWGTSSPLVSNCVFVSNSADAGGGMCNWSGASPTVSNCTFSGNYAATGHGIYNVSKDGVGSSPTVVNCILWDAPASATGREIVDFSYESGAVKSAGIFENSSTCSATYSCVRGGYAGEGNISADPMLATGAGALGRIRFGSPCIGAGGATATVSDVRGVGRVLGGAADMGSYELDDIDTDGISDAWEMKLFGDLTRASAGTDADGDGLTDADESAYGTAPFSKDSDGDGRSDGEEVAAGTDPSTPTETLRVNTANTSGVEDGRSWETAFTNIQKAVESVAAAGEGDVWVASGEYEPGADLIGNYVVSLRTCVALYGGFAGGEKSLRERNYKMNATIIDGKGEFGGVSGANGAILDGIEIRNCVADGGGGMRNDAASPVVSNCLFTSNKSDLGGGVNNNESAPIFLDCVFSKNVGTSSGGGVFNLRASPVLTSCSFLENRAERGGGVYSECAATPMAINCEFSKNEAGKDGGGMYNTEANAIVDACRFIDNSATSGDGGGVYNALCAGAMSGTYLIDNKAKNGGGVFYRYSTMSAVNCVFARNSAAAEGGGASARNDLLADSEETAPEFTNCTFYGNSAETGGGILARHCSPALMNVILWGDAANRGAEIYAFDANSLNVRYCCVQGGFDGNGNIADAPQFIDGDNNDYRLRTGSPCIDSGLTDGAPSVDVLGALRPFGAGVDIGAYELQGSNN